MIEQPWGLLISVLVGGIGLGGGLLPILSLGVAKVLIIGLALCLVLVAARQWALAGRWKARELEIEREREATETVLVEMRTALKEQSEKSQSYMRTLADVADRYATPFSEELTIVYRIGADASRDRVEQVHKTRALGDGPSDCLLWRTFEESATGHNARYSSFDSPINLAAWSDDDPYRVQFLPLEESPARLRGMVCFNPPLGVEPLTWHLRYSWPGMWKELRANGHDTAYYSAGEGLTRLTVAFVFPEKVINPRFTFSPRTGKIETRQKGGSTALLWEIHHPHPMKYEFAVAVDALP